MKLLSHEEFRKSGKWYIAIEQSGFTFDWHYYRTKYKGKLRLGGPNYEEYVKLFHYEGTKLGRLLHGVDDDCTNAE